MTSSFPSNSTLSPSSPSELLCPLLQTMISNTLNKDTGVNLAVHGVVSALGILENGLVLSVLGFRLQRKMCQTASYHVWVLNLALSDFLTTLTLPLFTHYLFMNHSWELGGPLCGAQPVWTQNHHTVSAAWKICGLGWAWAAVNAFPYFMFRSVVDKQDGRKLCYHNFALYSSSNTLHTDCKVRQAATAVSKVLLAFVIPLVVIAKSVFISVRLSESFTKMVISVIATFILCWVPYHVFCLLEVTAQYKTEIVEFVELSLPVATTFTFLNSVLNPIIYSFSCPNFCTRIRQSLGALFEGLVEEAGPLVRNIKESMSLPLVNTNELKTKVPQTHTTQINMTHIPVSVLSHCSDY
uniref:Prostaglandin D2 receptor 2 n=1 Tax=Sinocyclocheilus anshuiensis TaxID=1608454 RepID=A0A671S690_9TELE